MTILIDIISLFFNNEQIIKKYEENIIKLSNDKYNINFILVCNKSIDNTLHELNKLKKIYNNVTVILTNSNGCSLGKNTGILNSRPNSDYLLFLDSDITINSQCIDEYINSITHDVKYVSYFGGNIDNEKYIGGTFLNNDTVINNISEQRYLGGGCSLICNKLVNQHKLLFDVYYDPFIMQDVDFSFKVLSCAKIKNIKINNSNVSHLGSYTINQFKKGFYQCQLLRNSLYIMNKYDIFKKNILHDLTDFFVIYIVKYFCVFYFRKIIILISTSNYNFGMRTKNFI